nr:hypothetical protein [Nitrospirales bacterium]
AEVLLFRQKDPKPVTPRPASSDGTDASYGRAGQLAWLKQGPQEGQSVRLVSRTAGVERGRGEEEEMWEIQICLASTGRLGLATGQDTVVVSVRRGRESALVRCLSTPPRKVKEDRLCSTC